MKHPARKFTRELRRNRRESATAQQPGTSRGVARPRPPVEAAAVHAIQQGMPLEVALVKQTRHLLRDGDEHGAQAFAESLRAQPATEMLGRVLCGVVAHHRGYLDLAWHRLNGTPRSMWARFAAREYVRSGLKVAPDQTLAEISALVVENPEHLPVDTWFMFMGPVLAMGRMDVARQLLSRLDAIVEDSPRGSKALRQRIEGLRPWTEVDPNASVGERQPGTRFAVLDYRRPGAMEGSKNIGDHIQSIAALGHLVRHTGVRLNGEQELVEFLMQMRARTRPALRLDEIEAEVEVLTVQRDASEFQIVPDGTWTLCFGWYMHPIAGFRYGFPLNRALRPIFVSFHCNERGLLSDSAVEYLKEYGPVGCRDWTTVHLLLSMGVPAFFSGCLTTTISTVFPEQADDPAPEGTVAYVDVRPASVPAGAVQYRHALTEVRARSFAANCRDALDRLDTYRRNYARVVTSRLHAYLPVRSLGMDVDFVPDNPSDVRFHGLADLTDAEFDAIRDNLLDKLEKVFSAILGGSTEDEVYALWREITARDVEFARAHAAADPAEPIEENPLADQVKELVAATVTYPATSPAGHGDVVHCAVTIRKGDAPQLRALVQSLGEHTSRPLHLWMLAKGTGAKLQQEMAATFPQHSFSWLSVGGLGEDLRMLTGDRPAPLTALVLGELLPDVDKVAILPVDAVVTADIRELADLELGGHLFAAPTVTNTAHSSGFDLLHKAAARLKERTRPAATLLRNAYASHAFDFDAFDTEVMVLDLERMRSERFGEVAVGLSLRYALTPREVFHYMAGPDRSVVPPNWAHVPTHSPDSGAGLTHWSGETRPWDARYAPDQEVWRRHAHK